MTRLTTTPASDGMRMPAEYETQHGCLMIWPQRPGSWAGGALAARKAFAQIATEIAASEEVYMMAGADCIENARELLADVDRAHIIPFETDDAWARDTGPTFVTGAGKRHGIDWQFNAWGGTYDGLYASWDKDQKVAAGLCEVLGNDIYDATDFVLEGGSIHVDGEGTLITTEECLLSPGRNPKLNREDIERKLMEYLGVTKIIWLPWGIYNDETNGHVDNFCAFTGACRVVLAWTDDESDPQYQRSVAALDILQKATDAKGRPITVTKLPIPSKPICITEEDLKGLDFEEGEDDREVGERLAASYVNFYISNDAVLVPQFGDVNDGLALDILQREFEGRRVVGIPARDILVGGGNIHCITQQIPEGFE